MHRARLPAVFEVSSATDGTSFARSAAKSSLSSPLAEMPDGIRQRAIHADVAEIEMQAARACGSERREQQRQHFLVSGNAGFAVKLGADLEDFTCLREAVGESTQNAASVAKSRHAGFVEQMSIDTRHLRCDVGADAEQAAGQWIDDLECLQMESSPLP